MSKSHTSPLNWSAGDNTSSKVYITRVFNFGTWGEWQALKLKYSADEIKATVEQPLKGQWTKRAKAFAEVLFDIKMPQEAVISYEC